MSTESEMCCSLGTSVDDVTRLNVANVVRFSLYILLIRKFLVVDIFCWQMTIVSKVELVVKGRAIYITNEGPSGGIDKKIFVEVGIEYQRQWDCIIIGVTI